MRLATATVLLALCAAATTRAQDERPALAPRPWRAAAYGSAGGVLAGFPFPTAGVGVSGAVPFGDTFTAAPHMDAMLGSFTLLGLGALQIGVPVGGEVRDRDGELKYVAIGPTLTWAQPFGHVEPPVPTFTFVGGEILAGLVFPAAVKDAAELFVQARGFGGMNVTPLPSGGQGFFLFGAVLSVGFTTPL